MVENAGNSAEALEVEGVEADAGGEPAVISEPEGFSQVGELASQSGPAAPAQLESGGEPAAAPVEPRKMTPMEELRHLAEHGRSGSAGMETVVGAILQMAGY